MDVIKYYYYNRSMYLSLKYVVLSILINWEVADTELQYLIT